MREDHARQAKAEQIGLLQQEIERLRDALVDLVGCLIDEVERLRADAQRWDYVRGNLAQMLSPKMGGQHSHRFRMLPTTGCSVDEAVDKAIAICR